MGGECLVCGMESVGGNCLVSGWEVSSQWVGSV